MSEMQDEFPFLAHSGSGARWTPHQVAHTISLGGAFLSNHHLMAEECGQRRLAAIMATGVVGYGRLMEQEGRQWASESPIAVLSSTNFGDDPEQYFSDGITEAIIAELSRCRQSFMMA